MEDALQRFFRHHFHERVEVSVALNVDVADLIALGFNDHIERETNGGAFLGGVPNDAVGLALNALQHHRKATGNLEGTGVTFGGKFRNVFRWEQGFEVARRAEVFMQKRSRAATRDDGTFNEHGIGYFDSKASLQATGSLFQASSNER